MLLKIIFRNIITLILSIFGVAVAFFGLLHILPDNPVELYYGAISTDSKAYKEAVVYLGLDQSLFQQFIIYLERIFSGDFGLSRTTNQPVLEEFFNFFPATLELSVLAILIALIIGISSGILAAVKQNTWVDNLVMSGSLIGYSMPIFWWGMLLILFFSLNLNWMPVAGRNSFVFDIEPVTGFMLIDTLLARDTYGFAAFFNALHHLALPALVLATVPLAAIARMTRSSMIDVLGSEYILTARAKGVSQGKIIWVHGLRNAMIPLITVFGLQSSILLTGAILTETIFAWPGIGKWMVEAILRRDFITIQCGVFMISVFVIIINTSIDILYVLVNPRMRRPV